MAKTSKKEENSKYVVKRKISGITFLKMETHQPIYVKFESPALASIVKDKPASIATVSDLETGEINKLLISKVLLKMLEETYPNQTYVGAKFRIEKGEKVKGKSNEYNTYELSELE